MIGHERSVNDRRYQLERCIAQISYENEVLRNHLKHVIGAPYVEMPVMFGTRNVAMWGSWGARSGCHS